jgi:hypothetical protein
MYPNIINLENKHIFKYTTIFNLLDSHTSQQLLTRCDTITKQNYFTNINNIITQTNGITIWNPKIHSRIHNCLSLSWANPIQSIPTHPTSCRFILISFSHLPQKPYTLLSLPHPRYMARPYHSSRIYHPHNIGSGYSFLSFQPSQW